MMNVDQNSVCAVIPAAGLSSRMKTYKPLLKFDKKQTFIEKIVDEFLNFGCNQIIVVTNHEIYNEVNQLLSEKGTHVSVIINDKLEFERFYSIKLGLNEIKEKTYCFIHNCDNPFINQQILSTVVKNKIPNGFVCPIYNKKGGHPVLISKPIINTIVNTINNDENFRDIINHFPISKVKINTKNILININTRSDYQQISETL